MATWTKIRLPTGIVWGLLVGPPKPTPGDEVKVYRKPTEGIRPPPDIVVIGEVVERRGRGDWEQWACLPRRKVAQAKDPIDGPKVTEGDGPSAKPKPFFTLSQREWGWGWVEEPPDGPGAKRQPKPTEPTKEVDVVDLQRDLERARRDLEKARERRLAKSGRRSRKSAPPPEVPTTPPQPPVPPPAGPPGGPPTERKYPKLYFYEDDP
jgi:hypothetical protein